MEQAIVVSLVWIVGIICSRIMKKTEPALSKLYLVYVISTCLIFTLFVASHEFSG